MPGFLRQDAQLTKAVDLPNGANTTNSAGIDLFETAASDFVADCEVLISAPALSTTLLPDTQTVTYSLRQSNNANLSSDSELAALQIVQTGAGGAGAAAATRRFRLPTNVQRYIFLRCVKTGAANASSAAAELTVRA
jgi:hypothetical protein